MKPILVPVALLLALAVAASLVAVAQPQPQQTAPSPTRTRTFARGGASAYPEWEVKVLHPQEIAAGRYSQVRPYELDQLAEDGWELVSMTPFVMRNEEHEGLKGERPMVTQVYQSYAFKRMRRDTFR